MASRDLETVYVPADSLGQLHAVTPVHSAITEMLSLHSCVVPVAALTLPRAAYSITQLLRPLLLLLCTVISELKVVHEKKTLYIHLCNENH